MKTVEDWRFYWEKKSGADRIAMVDYCIDGVPLSFAEYQRLIIEPNLAQLAVERGQDVLEIGCGTGLHLDALEDIAGDLAGSDLSASLLATYRGRARTFSCEAAEQPFASKSFDRILMAGVALYFPDDAYFERVINEIVRLLRPSGMALISDMHFSDYKSRSGYRAYDLNSIVEILDRQRCDWSINNQTKFKRELNRRYNIILRIDPT
ncbi:MAG: class I SAM-dependent methyltransferase [Roseicyclus sp.]|uniref:class I SAM-dependent methyltransferase n=1 Tax=Roseicyclus sp. TaxID=1914329 RepID=UPI003A87A3DF